MLLNDSGTLAQWQEFISQYEQNLTTVKQHVDTVLNSSTATTAEKEQALSDYAEQKRYLDWLKGKYAEYESTGEVPADMTIDEEFSGDVYRYNNEIKIAEIPLDTTATPEIYHTIATVQRGTTQEFTIFQSEDLNLVLSVTAYQTEDATVKYKLQTGNYPALIIWAEGMNNMLATATGTWAEASGYTPRAPGYNSRNFYAFGYISPPQSFNNIPTWSNSNTSGLWGVKGYTPSGSDNPARWIAVDVVSLSINGTVDSPWDFYNDNLLPDDSENAVFPDGWQPTDPDDVPDEPQNLPHDDGEPPEQQEDRRITVPTMFITQYAVTARELTDIGSNLWTSWLTPNTDVWKNFFLPYAQDFGTLNIAACMDYIISLKVFPFEFPLDWLVPKDGVRMGTGHTDFLGGTAVVLNSQIYNLDMGECEIVLPNPYQDFRDMYNCSALCFMPYCGTVELNLPEILGRTLKAVYYIDCQSGGCTCVIKCAGDKGDYVIASKTGQIGFSLPMTATNAGQLTAQLMGDATKAIGTIGGLFFDVADSLAESAENMAKAIAFNNFNSEKIGEGKVASKDITRDFTATQSLGLGRSAFNTGLSMANHGIDMLSRSGIDMPMLSGGGSAESFMFADCVSIQIRRGKYKKPDNYPHSVAHYNLSSNRIDYYKGAFTGNPQTGSGTDKGLCQFTGIDTTGLDCRDDERAEIISLLESGVYL